ncbi:MAG: NirD/YgiW/YdeI family stress tolerance protein [Treponema sp.]|nr:NirD/YgiW/YdeI family stress tolerance protein [Treponema sp.]
MKRNAALLISLLLLTGLSVEAQEGYKGPGLTPVTVEEAKSLRDDSPVVLQGKIVKFLGDEKYLFSDGTGSITIEIDNRLWRGFSVNQDDPVEITGEIDKDFRHITIDVRSIKKM